MRVAFRTDASDAIGTGHFMRCLTLADALARHGHACAFVARDHIGAPLDLCEQHGHALHVLPRTGGSHQGDLPHSSWLGTTQDIDGEHTANAIGDGWDWVVVDHYALDHRWQDRMRSATRRILVIDDLADRYHACDLLLDQNQQVAPDRYAGLVSPGARVLLGPGFALLRPEFSAIGAALSPRKLGPDARVVVYFGGIDPQGATVTALQGIALSSIPGLAIDVVVGARNPHLAAIRAWVDGRPKATLHEGQADMPALMARAAVAIGAAGATAWERCCLSLPTILLTIAANQRPGAQALAETGAAFWLGDAETVDAAAVAQALSLLADDPTALQAMAAAGRALCDGNGSKRVLSAMGMPELRLRAARAADCDVVHGWRNHPDTRRYFHDPSPVPLADHRTWFARTLADHDRGLWIGEQDGEEAGVVRFDRKGDFALVSVYLVPGQSGKGFGTALIAAGCRKATETWPDLVAIDAEILPDNIASAKAFAKAGFVPYGDRWRLWAQRK